MATLNTKRVPTCLKATKLTINIKMVYYAAIIAVAKYLVVSLPPPSPVKLMLTINVFYCQEASIVRFPYRS